MIKTEREIYDKCPECGIGVYSGPIEADNVDGEVDVGDILYDSMPCPECNYELIYEIVKQWDDNCYVCGRRYSNVESASAEWNKEKLKYRWWCYDCDDSFLVSYLAELSRPLARVLYKPLTLISKRWDKKNDKK